MVLFLREQEVERLLPVKDVIDAVERAEKARHLGHAFVNPRQRMRLPNGMLHLMSAAWPAEGVLGYKAYTSFMGSPTLFLVHVFDAASGRPLAVLQANRLGQLRTGAATAVAARRLAPLDRPLSVGLIGTGFQAAGQIEALCADRPIAEIRVWSRDAGRRQAFAARWSEQSAQPVRPASSAREAVEGADVVVTCTTAREPVIEGAWLKPGAFVAGVGANNLLRRELDAGTMKRAALVVVDSLEQARSEAAAVQFGLETGSLHPENLRELSAVVAGEEAGRRRTEDIAVFHSMGSALWDLAAAWTCVSRARELGVGEAISLDGQA
jgi:ornithine cyclodeaminase/alanine dehydrogenase-like protein (mu-crystallin family)